MGITLTPRDQIARTPRLELWQIVLVAAISMLLATFLTTRLSITADPRMVLQPWLLNQGFIPYVHIADEHSPLLPQLLAWLNVLVGGDGIFALRLAHVTNLSLLFALLNGWLWHRYGSWAMMAGFAFIWAFSFRFGLTTFWYNLALAPVFFAYFILLADFSSPMLTKRVVMSGVLLGTGFLLKQQAIVLAPIFLGWLGLVGWQFRRDWLSASKLLLSFWFGAMLPIALYLAYYLATGGSLMALVEWTLLFNLTSGYAEMGFLLPTHTDLIAIFPAFLLVTPFIASFSTPGYLEPQERFVRIWLLVCALGSLIFLYPRYSVPHWTVAFAFIAAISAVICTDLIRLASTLPTVGERMLRAVVVSFLVFWTVYGVLVLWPGITGTNQPRLLKYDDQRELAELLASELPADSTFVLIPDNEAVSNTYYQLQRTPPHFWMMHYPWFMQPHVRERWLAELRQTPPDYVVWIDGLQDLSATGPEIEPYIVSHYTETSSFDWQGRRVHVLRRE